MDVGKYLRRIGFLNAVASDDEMLIAVHLHHVRHVPFENVDIYYKNLFDLTLENIYDKVVINNRGGFCYELNMLFNELLHALGFESRIIESRIFTETGELGPRFDHMSLYVKAEKEYLADVGFGDLFIMPLELREGVQADGESSFRIEKIDEQTYWLWMSKDNKPFEKKYQFDLSVVDAKDFETICVDKQVNPDSYFVKNLVCTRPTVQGRVTIFNKNLVERYHAQRIVSTISDDRHLREILKERFGMIIPEGKKVTYE